MHCKSTCKSFEIQWKPILSIIFEKNHLREFLRSTFSEIFKKISNKIIAIRKYERRYEQT